MNIVVPIKLVPDLVEELEINDEATDLERDFLTYRINEFDDHAIEEALQLKEAHGGSVAVVALEREETDKVLYTALAKGADKAVKITGLDEDASSHTAAKAMCKVLGDMEYDVVLTGVQAADDRDGQLGVLMASYLSIPHVSVVSDIAIAGDKLTLHKEYSGGVMASFEVTPKVLLGVQAARQTPRYAPVSRVRQIMKEAELDEVEVEAEPGAGSIVRRMYTPEKGEGAEMLDGSTEEIAGKIAALLNEKKG
ncbi:MAG: electron transfer flavoprotein subunit alpha [Planctomycetes bacterium]|jgi:electron transfer flavoprotein beta subunit|nr:electron transfer flavoprotein subunit alpha [Planctomycetota bacterium]